MVILNRVRASRRRAANKHCRRPEYVFPAVRLLRSHTVGPLAVIARDRVDVQAHFLFNRAAEEATDRVGLPASGLSEFGERSTRGPAQQCENLRGFGASPGSRRSLAGNLWLLAGLASCSGGMRWPFAPRRFGGGTFRGFIGGLFFRCAHLYSPFEAAGCRESIHHSARRGRQVNSHADGGRWRRKGDPPDADVEIQQPVARCY